MVSALVPPLTSLGDGQRCESVSQIDFRSNAWDKVTHMCYISIAENARGILGQRSTGQSGIVPISFRELRVPTSVYRIFAVGWS